MLLGQKVGLRARQESDLPVLLDELYNDVATRSRADTRPWVPVSPDGTSSPYSVTDLPETVVCFSVVDLTSNKLAGEALLWSIDTHNRSAHLGISIRPLFRGHGLASDVIQVLCWYGFVTRGLNRLQIDTLADNEPMRRAALAAGFTLEATLRRAAWVSGEFLDEIALGLLATEWHPNPPPPEPRPSACPVLTIRPFRPDHPRVSAGTDLVGVSGGMRGRGNRGWARAARRRGSGRRPR